MTTDIFQTARMFAPKAYAPRAGKNLMSMNLVEKTVVYLMPKELSMDEKKLVGLVFMIMGTSKTATLEQWKSYVCSYTCFLIPGMQSKLKPDSYAVVTVSKANLAPVLARVQAYVDASVLEEAENALPDDGLAGLALHPGLPPADAPGGYKWCGAEATMKHTYAHYSLVVFLAGKNIDDQNRTSITENRPRAVIGKCSLDEITETLNGSLRLSDESHTYINAAWSEMTIFRAACFLEFVNYASMDVNMAQDIIYTSVHLLRYTGMSHARFSYKLIKSNPWVREFPPLQSSVAVFEDSLRESQRVPSVLQPYLKLIFADKSSLFPRKEMEPLVACAAALEQQMHESVQQFFRSDKYAATVDLFLDERNNRAVQAKGKKKVATLAELEDNSDDEYGPTPGSGTEAMVLDETVKENIAGQEEGAQEGTSAKTE